MTRAALGGGMVLLVTVLGSFALAYALSLTLGGIYVPFAMPLVLGFLIGAIGGFIGRRFELTLRRPVILAALLGATIAYVGYHVLAYMRVVDICAAQWAAHLPSDVPKPDAALALIEEATGRTGFMAYLAFVSEGSGAALSPIGLLGRTQPGLGVTIAVSAVELVLANVAAVYAMLWRTRATAPPKLQASLDEAGLRELRTALGRLDWGGAGRVVGASMPSASDAAFTVRLALTGGVARLEVFALGPDGRARELVEQRTIGEAQAVLLQEAYHRARLDAGKAVA
ncbi:MAG: hypothetical protein U1F43_32635 [Myxococcota bacterium]